MRYFALALVAVVAAKKKCNRDIKEEPCKDDVNYCAHLLNVVIFG